MQITLLTLKAIKFYSFTNALTKDYFTFLWVRLRYRVMYDGNIKHKYSKIKSTNGANIDGNVVNKHTV